MVAAAAEVAEAEAERRGRAEVAGSGQRQLAGKACCQLLLWLAGLRATPTCTTPTLRDMTKSCVSYVCVCVCMSITRVCVFLLLCLLCFLPTGSVFHAFYSLQYLLNPFLAEKLPLPLPVAKGSSNSNTAAAIQQQQHEQQQQQF